MSTVYERVADGYVVERVQPVPGDYEDTRLGVAVIDGEGGWRVVGQEAPAPMDPIVEAIQPYLAHLAEATPATDEPAPPAPSKEK